MSQVPQHGHHVGQSPDHGVPVDDDLGVVGVEIVGNLAGVFQVDGVHVHADGKGADGLFQLPGRNGADQAGIQPAGEQKAQRRIGVQPLVHAGHQLFADVCQDGGHIVVAAGGHIGNVAVAHELAVAVVAADGERVYFLDQPHQVFGFRREGDGPRRAVPVEQRPDADGVTGGDQLLRRLSYRIMANSASRCLNISSPYL